MIARVWKGTTLEKDTETYLQYLEETGLKDYRKTEGNLGVQLLLKTEDGISEFVIISLWDSFDSIRKFSGKNIDKARYYPKDKKYLLKLEPNVAHYTVTNLLGIKTDNSKCC
ncbi:MAG: antibiotic biosynthesis monooxygenase [Bacteroidota bacterium]|jgi:heme-degrading monooxygenase HmoA